MFFFLLKYIYSQKSKRYSHFGLVTIHIPQYYPEEDDDVDDDVDEGEGEEEEVPVDEVPKSLFFFFLYIIITIKS